MKKLWLALVISAVFWVGGISSIVLAEENKGVSVPADCQDWEENSKLRRLCEENKNTYESAKYWVKPSKNDFNLNFIFRSKIVD